MNTVKTFEENPGVMSWTRIVLFVYFLIVALPGSWLIIIKTLDNLNSMTWETMIYALSLFTIVHAVWITPKVISKALEGKGIIGKMINKK